MPHPVRAQDVASYAYRQHRMWRFTTSCAPDPVRTGSGTCHILCRHRIWQCALPDPVSATGTGSGTCHILCKHRIWQCALPDPVPAQDVEVRQILCARSCAHRIWYVPYPVPGTGYGLYPVHSTRRVYFNNTTLCIYLVCGIGTKGNPLTVRTALSPGITVTLTLVLTLLLICLPVLLHELF